MSAQREALEQLQKACRAATETGLFDVLATAIHPDTINSFCDGVSQFKPVQNKSDLENIKQAINEFEELQTKYAKFGAADTEPDGIFQVCLIRAMKGKDACIPQSANGWELYSTKSGSERAAMALNRQTAEVVKLIQATTDPAVRDFLKDFCWRVSS